ncbi:MAG: hypothetical protein IKM29_01040 [Clostridia bacterium]|nr:hypothetical protein [Clostridia bacterium]
MPNIDKRLCEVLENKNSDYNMPFLWMKGEERSLISRELNKIYDCGIRGVCVESRPHEEFCRDQWWGDMELILDTCKDKGMDVWLLDDKHFPTGEAAGAIDEKYPHLKKKCIAEKHTDVRGPVSDGVVILPELDPGHELICVVAAKRRNTAEDEKLSGELIDLSDCVADGLVFCNLPSGLWRIFAFVTHTVEDHHMDPLDPDSVDVLIKEVYQTHYDRFAPCFGNVFKGFFSDEPYIKNSTFLGLRGENSAHDSAYPWNDRVKKGLQQKLGDGWKTMLPAIWSFIPDLSPKVRLAYMDTVTELYSTHFNKRVSDWCHEHGVEYIGHVIEDYDMHCGFSSGGHYFRALDSMDMAGIDVVLCQIVPGMQDHRICVPCWYNYADPNFFSFGLAKLASSHAHIQPKMKGRAMCEMFGAYGWAEGLKMMKWLVDHMVVRGINRFVPHAFSMTPDDPDCPPHFYADGKNPQYEGFGLLMRYADRQIHLTTAGEHVCGSAVLYHAEAEWAGGEYMYFQSIARALTEAQLEFDIVSADHVLTSEAEEGKLKVNSCRFESLIVPQSEYLPEKLLNKLSELSRKGIKIIWVGEKTQKSAEGAAFNSDFGSVTALCSLDRHIRENIGCDISLSSPFRHLRYCHRTDGSADVYMLFNESVDEVFDGTVCFSAKGEMQLYDPWENKVYSCPDGKIKLAPYETRFAIFGTAKKGEAPVLQKEECTFEPRWSFQINGEDHSELFNLARKYPRFGGKVTYTAEFSDCMDAKILDLGFAGETARVILNGHELGTKIAPPYRFVVSGLLESNNTLEVEVTTHLGYARRDWFSTYHCMEPMGLLGPVALYK